MRAVQERLDVTVHPLTGGPQRFTWRGRPYAVHAVLDRWRIGGRWWLGEGPSTAFLAEVGAGAFELHRADTGEWWLVGVVD